MTPLRYFDILSYENLEQRKKWRELSQSLNDTDIFYYPEYSYLFELKGDGNAFCFVYYESPTDFVLYPFLKRRINELNMFADLSGDLFDITSPYGYGGYLPSSTRVDMANFFKIFRQYLRHGNIVSEFVRFHPILENYIYSQHQINLELWNETVYIDLLNDDEIIWNNVKRVCRQAINKASNNNVTISYDSDCLTINSFYTLYIDTMKKVGADIYYFFSKSWFDSLVNHLHQNIIICNALWQGEIIASILHLFNEYYMYAFLSASNQDKLYLRPLNLLFFKSAMWAKNKGLKKYHLGGGLKLNDSLFRFKALFSPLRAPFHLGKFIHNQEFYEYLCNRNQHDRISGSFAGDFFPLYRK
jgi:serine/alanine adding enzyme